MRAFITGVDGFAGSHLADYLLDAAGAEVAGCGLSELVPAYLAAQVEYSSVDLRDRESLSAVLRNSRPDRIYHLAGQAFVPASWEAPWQTFEANVQTTLNVLDIARNLAPQPRVLIVSSVEVYGAATADAMPLLESHPFNANSPYSVSKVAQDLLGLSYARSHDLHVVRARPLNHIGPRQNERFVAAAFARQIARSEAGLQSPEMKVGDLSARRDFTDVRDTVRAYYLLSERGRAGEAYNIASGELRSVQTLLDGLRSLSSVDITITADAALFRAADTPPLTVDCSKLRETTGWQPEIPFEQTLQDLLDYQRQQVRAAAAVT